MLRAMKAWDIQSRHPVPVSLTYETFLHHTLTIDSLKTVLGGSIILQNLLKISLVYCDAALENPASVTYLAPAKEAYLEYYLLFYLNLALGRRDGGTAK